MRRWIRGCWLTTLFGCVSGQAQIYVEGTLEAAVGGEAAVVFQRSGNMALEVWRRPMAAYPEPWVKRGDYAASQQRYRESVESGQAWEYVLRNHLSGQVTYLAVGDALPLTEDRGILLLAVDETLEPLLRDVLARLELDLVGDGWTVQRISHGRHLAASHQTLRAKLRAAWEAAPERVRGLLLFGHLPVAYSGVYAPDGHASIRHETDQIYADVNGDWPDENAFPASASGNDGAAPGDGHYDPVYLDSNYTMELMTGRVDFANMPAFGKSEVDLLRDYIHKAHAWRSAQRVMPRRALAYNNYLFRERSWIYSMFGAGNVDERGFQPAVAENDYLFVSDFGELNGASTFYTESDWRVLFAINFGSYKQSWNKPNNAMRAIMARPDYGLSCVWGAWDPWTFHTMQAGAPLGLSALHRQNPAARNSLNALLKGTDYIHHNLMGDPSLRLHPIAPPENLQLRIAGSGVELNWEASADTDILGYHVYRAANRLGPYQRLNAELLTGTAYTDDARSDGASWYQVRAVRWEQTPTTRYLNASIGTFNAIDADSAVNTVPRAHASAVQARNSIGSPMQFAGEDEDGDRCIPIILRNPAHGALHWSGGLPVYVADAGFAGVDTVRLRLFDGVALSSAVDVPITVVAGQPLLASWQFQLSGITAPDIRQPDATVKQLSVPFIEAGVGLETLAVTEADDGLSFRSLESAALDETAYIALRFEPDPHQLLTLERLLIGLFAEADATVHCALRASADGFASYTELPLPLAEGRFVGKGLQTGAAWPLDVALGAIGQIDGPLELRLYLWGAADASVVAGIGKLPTALKDVALTGRLQPDTARSYAEWQAAIDWPAPEQAALTANPDNDAFSNFEEYALGMNPLQHDAASEKPTFTQRRQGTRLLLAWQTRESVISAGLQRRFEVSDNLRDWQPAANLSLSVAREVILSNLTGDGSTALVEYQLRLPLATGHRFARFVIAP